MTVEIPSSLTPYFQEYDTDELEFNRDANLIIQRTLEFGTWQDVRWLFLTFGTKRIRLFVRQHGERMLRPVAFNYWRKLLKIRHWQNSPFLIPKGELWKH